MIGIDAINKDRLIKKYGKLDDLALKVLSKSELKEYHLSNDKIHYFATRWAIKEALFKCDNKYFEFSKINITKENGRYTFENFEISTTSEENLIIAIAYKH